MNKRLQHLVVLILGVIAVASLSATHFTVSKSSPSANQALTASPKRVQIWYSQVPAEGVSQLKLLAADKSELPVGKTVVDKPSKSMYADVANPLKPGAYVVSWRAAGDDGHVLTGEIKFTLTEKK
jgi:methionine-rich copper-binding protein CopC